MFAKFSPSASLTTESGGSARFVPYNAEVSIGNAHQLECVLTEVPTLEEKYADFTFQDIDLASPPQGKKMKKGKGKSATDEAAEEKGKTAARKGRRLAAVVEDEHRRHLAAPAVVDAPVVVEMVSQLSGR